MATTLWLGDTHCGAMAGLLAPKHQRFSKLESVTKVMWESLMQSLDGMEFDQIITGGDLTEGAGHRGGSRDVLSVLAEDQIDYACEALRCIRERFMTPNGRFYGVKGTPYHTVFDGVDAEALIAKELGFERMEFEDYYDFGGHVVHAKHNIGGGGLPHTRGNQLSKTKMWNMYEEERELAPKAHSFVRWHVHHHELRSNRMYTAMTAPCLKAPYDEYGQRKCEGWIDTGFLTSEMKDGSMEWKAHFIEFDEKPRKAVSM